MSALNSKNEKIFQLTWTTFFILVTLIAMVPILRVVSMSFSSKEAINAGRVTLLPIGFTTEAYVKALTSGSFIRAFGYSIVLMLGSTAVNLLMTVLAAYPLSKKHLIGGNAIMTLFVLTMYLNPGIIPEYLNVRDFGLIDKVWALIIPGALSAYNMIIMCNSFKGIDSAIYDAAKIDGCSEARTLVSVILPLVYPTLATLGLFYAVGRWNGISDVLYYINSSKYFTVQMVLKQFIESITISVQEGMQSNLVADNVKSASIVISMLPMLIVYPFVQKFFTKGIMIGAVKG
ncbi:MAG: carbohydrate ABC transporter permease [Lachnospiraceae bacterium]|jgi:putative aldouronate transport system permease protein|nr:carbohydrate ABC transporter permease [Lachnospiraceae bacterium]